MQERFGEFRRGTPRDEGLLQLIVRRPNVNEREVLKEAELDVATGLVGDSWIARGSSRTPDGSSRPDMQLNLMNSRVIALIAREKDRWPPAGDQLCVDPDLSGANLPPGTRPAIGAAIIEGTAEPHTGCRKFMARFVRGRPEVRQLADREAASPSRHQRESRARRSHPGGRIGQTERGAGEGRAQHR